jgi:hypothetical protein
MHRHRIRAFVTGSGETDVPVAIFAEGQFLRFVGGAVRTFGLGPGTTTINALATWGDTTGTQLLNTSVLLDNAGNMTQLVTLDGQDAPRITATLATATPTTGKLTTWASNAAPWKLDSTVTLQVVNIDGIDTLYGVGGINGRDPAKWVEGPASATNTAIVRFDSTTGKLIKGSTVFVGDDGSVSNLLNLSSLNGTVSGFQFYNGVVSIAFRPTGSITGLATLNGIDPATWVRGPASATVGNLAYYSSTSGKTIGPAVVSVDGSGNLTGVGTLNGARWVKPRFTASTTDRIATWYGSTADTIQETTTTIDSSGNMGSVNTINGVSPSNWVQGPASSTDGRVALFNATSGKLIKQAPVSIDASGNVTSVTTLNGFTPANWVQGPGSITTNAVPRFTATNAVANSGAFVDAAGNMTVATINGRFPNELLPGNTTFFGGSTGFSPGYGLTKRASSYRVGFVAFVPVSFGDTTGTISLSMSSSDNNGEWMVQMPNASAARSLGVGGTWPNPGTFTSAGFIFAATCVVPAGSGIHSLNLNISSSGSMTMLTGWQMWTIQ